MNRRDEIEGLGVCRGECRHRSGNLCLNTGDGLDATSQAQTNFRVEPVYLAPRVLGATVVAGPEGCNSSSAGARDWPVYTINFTNNLV